MNKDKKNNNIVEASSKNGGRKGTLLPMGINGCTKKIATRCFHNNIWFLFKRAIIVLINTKRMCMKLSISKKRSIVSSFLLTILLILPLFLLLTACVNTKGTNLEISQQQQQKQNYPSGVTSGETSINTYSEVMRYFSKEEDYYKRMMSRVDEINADKTILEDEKFIKEFKEMLNEYEAYLKGFNLKPETRTDFEVFDLFNEMISNEKYIIQELRKALDGDLSYHAKRASEYNNNMAVSLAALTNSLEKNDLLLDSN